MSKARILGMPSRPVRDKARRKEPFRKKWKRGEEMKSRKGGIEGKC